MSQYGGSAAALCISVKQSINMRSVSSVIIIIESVHEISNNVVCHLSILWLLELLTEHHLEFLRLKGGCRGSSKS